MLGFETILPFLRPLEPLILDDSVSEIMVNGAGHVFIERAGVLEEVPDIHLTEQSLMVAVKNIARRTITKAQADFNRPQSSSARTSPERNETNRGPAR
jgi:pilus assembly protein CpaF